MVDTFKTRTQLIERAAKDLGILEPGETLSTEDAETFEGLVDPLFAQLAADGVAYVSDTEEIELELFLPLARLLANIAGPDFGSPINEQAKRLDEQTLRRLTGSKSTGEVMKAVYY